MTLLAWTPTPEFWALMTLIAGGVTKFIYQVHKDRVASRNLKEERESAIAEREQARLDLAAVAALTVDQVESVKKAFNEQGQIRLKALLQSNVTTRQYTKKAIDTANNVNQKIESLGQSLVDSRSTPQKVHVTNTAEDPVIIRSE